MDWDVLNAGMPVTHARRNKIVPWLGVYAPNSKGQRQLRTIGVLYRALFQLEKFSLLLFTAFEAKNLDNVLPPEQNIPKWTVRKTLRRLVNCNFNKVLFFIKILIKFCRYVKNEVVLKLMDE